MFQSNLRKQIRKLPKILKSVKMSQYYSILFIRVLNLDAPPQEIIALLAVDRHGADLRTRMNNNSRQFSNLFSQIRLKKRHTSLFSGICREIRTKFHQKFAEDMQNSTQKMKKIGNSIIQSRKNVDDFLAEILRLKNSTKECIV